MRVSAVFEGLWLVKIVQCKLIGNHFVLPHDTIPSNVVHYFKTKIDTMKPLMCTLFIIFFFFEFAQSQSDTIQILYKGEEYYKLLNVVYPPYAIDFEIQGTVVYKIHINKDGCLDSLLITDSPHMVLSDEIKRAYASLKCDWNPVDLWIEQKFIFHYQ